MREPPATAVLVPLLVVAVLVLVVAVLVLVVVLRGPVVLPVLDVVAGLLWCERSWYRSNMPSNLTREMLRGPSSPLAEHRSRPLSQIDPIALGQAGLQALALAGTAILARYAHVEDGAEGMSELAATLPHSEWNILERALGAFSDPVREGPGDRVDDAAQEVVRADALVAMCLRARTVLAREHPAGSPLARTR